MTIKVATVLSVIAGVGGSFPSTIADACQIDRDRITHVEIAGDELVLRARYGQDSAPSYYICNFATGGKLCKAKHRLLRSGILGIDVDVGILDADLLVAESLGRKLNVVLNYPPTQPINCKTTIRDYPDSVRLAYDASYLFARPLNTITDELRGVVDLHTHPMSHLAFGGKVFYGAPDVDILVPAGNISCNIMEDRRAKSVGEAIGSCYGAHGGHDFLHNPCGNHTRRFVLDKFEDGRKANKPHDVDHPDGPTTFSRWPMHHDLLHQMMWVDWLRRAYDGGLRVMVALAVNSVTLAKGVDGTQPYDDVFTGDRQIDEMKHFVSRHAWMQIAYSSQDLRRIVGSDKLAVILGVELDDIGNLAWNRVPPTPEKTKTEVRRLHDKGVRYIFPVHLIDNYFGGTAVYEIDLAWANRYQTGDWWNLVCANPNDGIGQRFERNWEFFAVLEELFKGWTLAAPGETQLVPTCPDGIGIVNARGLSDMGRVAIAEMMHLGMIIDIDHMSQRTVQDTLEFTRDATYPLVSGHNGLRGGPNASENSRTQRQYKELSHRGGLAGVGWENIHAMAFPVLADRVSKTGIPIALGTDINGFAKAPPPRPECRIQPCVRYSRAFPMAHTFEKWWDYNSEGVAHYGLLPDFLRDVEKNGGERGREVVEQLFYGAEAAAQTWERTEWVSWVIKLWKGATPDAFVAAIVNL